MEKSGSPIANALAYNTEYATARANQRFAEQAAERKGCDLGNKPPPCPRRHSRLPRRRGHSSLLLPPRRQARETSSDLARPCADLVGPIPEAGATDATGPSRRHVAFTHEADVVDAGIGREASFATVHEYDR
jgi:hypothetical protein